MLQTHERLGDFEILGLLGKGGMGEVYESLQSNPQRRVALKVLASWLAQDADALQRFWREARVLANLDHPGIVRIISTGTTPAGIAYYAMHLVRGISLAELIRRANAAAAGDTPTRSLETADTSSAAVPLPNDADQPAGTPAPRVDSVPPCLYEYRHNRFATVARIGVQAARALAYAHEQGHLHRDVKPSNMMVDVHNQVYLVDFGLTRALEPTGDGTQSGALVGTPWYMSPEQANAQPLDARSDIYSLGVALFELATQGLGPFTASRDNRSTVLAQVRTGQTLPLRTLAPGIPPALERVILRAMQLRPRRRYASAEEMAHELEELLSPSLRQPPCRARPSAYPLLRRWPGVAAVAVLGTVLAAAVLLVPNWSDRPTGAPPSTDDPPVVSAPATPVLDQRAALPEVLRHPVLGLPMPLIKNNHEPLWSEVVFGTGRYRPQLAQTDLESPIGTSPTLLALADSDQACFEFTVQLMQLKSFVAGVDHELGIFFGWRRQVADADAIPRFFVIELAEHPKEQGTPPQLRIGTACAAKAQGARGELLEWLRPLPARKGTIPLAQVEVWQKITVRVLHEKVAVSVGSQPTVEFSLPWLTEADPLAATNLRAPGALGVWACNGHGLFKNAAVTALRGN